MQIAIACQKRGHHIEVFTKEWRGDRPKGFKIHEIAITQWRNFRQDEEFIRIVQNHTKTDRYDRVIGFNKMPGLDVYFAADGCFKAKTDHGWKRTLPYLSSRYRFYNQCEYAVFNPESKIRLLLLSKLQRESFQKYYAMDDDRYKILSPGISNVTINVDDAKAIRASFRGELGLTENDQVLLMVGSGFRTKGLDRAIKTFAMLPEDIKLKTLLYVVGEGKQQWYIKLAKQLQVYDRLCIFGGRDDVSRFLFGCDILIHPAITETAGKVILEAMIHGLPVLTTDNCGYADFVTQANAGIVAKSPFTVNKFASLLAEMMNSEQLHEWSANGLDFGKNQEFCTMINEVVKIIEAH
ncbi:MAG: glycosyltransferase family 4 protein [Methylococcaceae bacterium]